MRQLLTLTLLVVFFVALPVRVARADDSPDKPKAAPAPVDGPTLPAPVKLVVVWPTFSPAGDDASPTPLHRPTSTEEPLATHAHELDATLRDATQDLGFVLDLGDAGPAPGHARDTDLIARAARARPGDPSGGGSWVVSARLEQLGGDSFLLRLVVVRPNGKELRTRVEVVRGADISLRGLVLLRDLLSTDLGGGLEATSRDRSRENVAGDLALTKPSRSPGRAILATSGALFGGAVGYSLVRSTGTSDPRVLYPLLTLGSAVGIGAALLASEEWDIGTGDAWYLSAGAWWGGGAGILLANGTNVLPYQARYGWGIGGGLAGVGLATFALTRSKMDEGDAVLTNSGAVFGAWVGALAQFAYQGTTLTTPYTGTGMGSAIGLVGAGAASIWVKVPPSRVLLIDLGAGLGSLAGAAAGSPLIFSGLTGTPTTANATRGFLACTLAGTLGGGAAGYLLTRDSTPKKNALLDGLPMAGIIGASQTKGGEVPAYGLSYSGTF